MAGPAGQHGCGSSVRLLAREGAAAQAARRALQRRRRSGARRVVFEPRDRASGDAETAIARAALQPDAVVAGASFWGRLLNYEADKPYVADENPSIVRTPLVIAMWEPLAEPG